MHRSVIPVSPGLIEILSGGKAGITPFRQEIFLLEIVVAGTSYSQELAAVEETIIPETILTLKRDPENPFDEFAIAVNYGEVRIGFVPADMNLVCSRLMDAGKLFFCRVVSKERLNNWLKIKANIYMVE